MLSVKKIPAVAMERRAWTEKLNTSWTNVAVSLMRATSSSLDEDTLCVSVVLALTSALLLLSSSLLAVRQRCTFRGRYSGEILVVCYSFLGNVCSTVGATLSRDLYLQVAMAASAAAVDAVHCLVSCIALSPWFNSKAERRQTMMKRWRRRHLLALSGLLVFGSGSLKWRFSHGKAFRPVGGRNLLHAPVQVSSRIPFMDNAEILGYVLGLLSCAVSCTSRFPALCKACKGLLWMETSMLSVLVSLLAGALYTAAILVYDTQTEFLIRVMPWLLSSVGGVVLELLILVFQWRQSKDGVQSVMFSSDTESCSEIVAEDDIAMERERKWPMLSPMQTQTKDLQKTTVMGLYMDVGVQSLRKEEEVEFRPLNGMRQMMRSDSFSSTDTSCDSSSVSSNLEWDIEAANAQWREPAPKEQRPEFSER